MKMEQIDQEHKNNKKALRFSMDSTPRARLVNNVINNNDFEEMIKRNNVAEVLENDYKKGRT